MDNELIYQIGVTLIDKIGNINGKKLIAYCGGAEAVFKESKKNLQKIPGIGKALVDNILSAQTLDRAEEEIKFIEKNNIQTFYYLDPNYPKRLYQCDDSPLILYYKGNANLNAKRVVAVVGTRHMTEYGASLCEKLVTDLASDDILIVSGLAYGVDSIAHSTAVKNRIPTVACLGHGLQMIYPPDNRDLAKRMLNNGGLLSEFISGTKPDYMHFPQRNRIIAGLADCVVVVESAMKGGAIITATIANSYSRDVFAFPGRTTDIYSQGCNYLIRTHQADIVESAKDINYLMRWDNTSKKEIQTQIFREFSDDEQKIMDAFGNETTVTVDYLINATDMNAAKLASLLLNLEFDGVLTALPGKRYHKN